MGRTREYEEGSVLTGAMNAFRRKGYFAVSIKDLEEATQLKSGSIYNRYKDKAGLYAAAFAHYNETVLCRRISRFSPEEAGLSGLRELFLTLLREPNGESFGCLITNSAIEFGGEESPVLDEIKEDFQILQTTFSDRLASAAKSGLLRQGIDPKLTARKLLVLYQGILVLVRGGYSKASLKNIINAEFDSLEEN